MSERQEALKYLSSELTHSTDISWHKVPFQLSDLFREQENPFLSSEAKGFRRRIPGAASSSTWSCLSGGSRGWGEVGVSGQRRESEGSCEAKRTAEATLAPPACPTQDPLHHLGVHCKMKHFKIIKNFKTEAAEHQNQRGVPLSTVPG